MSALSRVILSPFGGVVGRTDTPELAAGWAMRAQETRVAVLLALLAILNWTDLMYTLFAKSIHMLNEVNPIAQAYLAQSLGMSFVCYKVLMVLAGTTMLWRVRKSKWAVPACWLLVAVHVGLSIVWYLWVVDVTSAYEAILGAG